MIPPKNTPIAVFGLGISNMSAIRYLIAHGYTVHAWDDNADARDKAAALGAVIATYSDESILVMAPGVPHTHDVFQKAKTNGADIICDIELRYRMGWTCKTVGITGTNGKSTTTALIGHTLQQAGMNAVIGGNIGVPICDLDIPGDDGVLVLELSSFQLEICPTFRPEIAVLANITPDHLDRHGNMDGYTAAKAIMFGGEGDAIIIKDDEYCARVRTQTKRRILTPPTDITEQPALKGPHNIENMQAAYAVCTRLGVVHDDILRGFETFTGVQHRQSPVRTMDHVTFINDSIATGAESASKAIAAFENIHWIIGGQIKVHDFIPLIPHLKNVTKTYIIGHHAEDYIPFLEDHHIAYEVIEHMKDAVTQAYTDAKKTQADATVLLSPAGTSFDQYKNFSERGEDFERVVATMT